MRQKRTSAFLLKGCLSRFFFKIETRETFQKPKREQLFSPVVPILYIPSVYPLRLASALTSV